MPSVESNDVTDLRYHGDGIVDISEQLAMWTSDLHHSTECLQLHKPGYYVEVVNLPFSAYSRLLAWRLTTRKLFCVCVCVCVCVCACVRVRVRVCAGVAIPCSGCRSAVALFFIHFLLM